MPQIRRVGEYFRDGTYEGLAKRFGFIKEVRGFGLMVGVELSMPCKDLVIAAMHKGLLMNCTHETVLRFLPPYIITESEVDHAVEILDSVFRTV